MPLCVLSLTENGVRSQKYATAGTSHTHTYTRTHRHLSVLCKYEKWLTVACPLIWLTLLLTHSYGCCLPYCCCCICICSCCFCCSCCFQCSCQGFYDLYHERAKLLSQYFLASDRKDCRICCMCCLCVCECPTFICIRIWPCIIYYPHKLNASFLIYYFMACFEFVFIQLWLFNSSVRGLLDIKKL